MNRLALISLCILLWPTGATAQVPRARSCSYADCALRVVDGGGWFGSQVVVRGQEGYAVAQARRSPTLEDLFAVNDSAATYYANFETHDRYADWAGWLGTGLMLVGFVVDIAGEGGFFSKSFLFYGSGLAVTYGVSLPQQRMASTDLSNAIWWYNRTLNVEP